MHLHAFHHYHRCYTYVIGFDKRGYILRAFIETSTLTVHVTIVAMGMNIGTYTLTLLSYTGKEFQALYHFQYGRGVQPR